MPYSAKIMWDYGSRTVRQFFDDKDVRREMCRAIATNCGIGGGGTGVVDSVFGRSGVVTAQAGDYTFAQIGATPTTLAGYGITDALSLSSPLTGFVTSTNSTITASDTILGGFQKAQAQIDAINTGFAAGVRNTMLTGYAVGTNAAISAGDTILQAFGKTQGQIDARITLTSPITGYVVGSNAVLAATDTILQAFGKLQGSLNVRVGLGSTLSGFAVGANTPLTAANTIINGFGVVQGQINARALIDSPTFTGTPAAPTAATGTNTTQIATTAFVTAAFGANFITASSPPLTFGEVAANSFEDLGLTVTGAAIGDVVAVGVPGAAQVDGAAFFAMVSNTNVVDIRCINPTTSPITVPEGVYKVTVFKI